MNDTDRFMAKVSKQDNGCWIWTASKFQNGYGRFIVDHSCIGAHRFSYEHFKSAIPSGLQIDHLCKTKSCVNPDHLEVVTLQENIRRFNVARTHCKRGHEFTPENTYFKKGNKRVCRTCQREAGRKYKSRLAAAEFVRRVNGYQVAGVRVTPQPSR